MIATLRGIGQIFLLNNALSGLLIVIGIAVENFSQSFVILLAAWLAQWTASTNPCFADSNRQSGLYSFSPALVGVALWVFFKPSLILWLLLVVGSILAAGLQALFIKRNIPVYTLPFILITWLLYFLIQHYSLALPVLSSDSQNIYSSAPTGIFIPALKSYGQVIFQNSWWSGLFFAIAIFIHSPKAFIYSVIGLTTSLYLATHLQYPQNAFNLGLCGYNSVLTSLALYYSQERFKTFWVVLGSLIAFFIYNLFTQYSPISTSFLNVGGVLTLPFVLGTWVTRWIISWFTGLFKTCYC